MTSERWQRLKELFHAALELETGERPAFLDQVCAGDPALRSQLEALLASDERASSFLESPILEEASLTPADPPDVSAVGRRIGPYKILRAIGHGGMGTVYLAERADEQFRKQVAIKLVQRGMDTEAIRHRFRHEQQILANLDHPNIAKLLDGGTTEEGRSYFIMDYVEGLPIHEYCARHRLTTAERLALFRTVCSAVQYAHAQHVVHRDLKPGNILVTADGVPKLLDFGIAKVLDPEPSPPTADPTGALRLMTPDYASPEQVRGWAITPASDVYALGVLLYELLTGQRPYRLAQRTPQAIERVLCETEPEKPSTLVRRQPADGGGKNRRSLSALGSHPSSHKELAGDLDHIVLMALRKEPERRYSSVAEFSEDIGRHLEGLPVIARKDTFGYRSAKFIRRNKASVLTAATSALILLLMGIGLYLLARRGQVLDKPIRSVAVLPLENLSGDAAQEYFADGMTEALITDLAQIGALQVISRTSVMHYKGTRQPLPEIARALNVEAVVEGSVLRSGERVRITAQLIEAATDRHLWARTYERDLRDVLALQSEVASAIAQEIKIKLSPQEQARLASKRPVGRDVYEAYLKGRYFLLIKGGHEGVQKAVEFFQQAIEKDPGYAPAYAGLADSYSGLSFGDEVPSGQHFRKAKEAAIQALEQDDTLAEAHVALAKTLNSYDWDWPSAEREFRRGLELNPSYAIGHGYYALYLSAMGRHREAIAEAKRAQELDPLSPLINHLAGRCYFYARQYDQALEQNRKALEIDPNHYVSLLYSARVYALKGMYREALAELQKTRERALDTQSSIGVVYAESGRPRQAQHILEELLALSKQRYVPSGFIMRIYLALGQNDQAFAWLEKVVQEKGAAPIWLKVDPMYDNVRSDPRFAELLQRLRFPP